ncbi:MAG: hypothetical protein WAN23_04900 [Candidatus Acidiferrales bacterium]
MSVFETYSKRKKAAERAGTPDVYQYDALPNPLRVQIIHIWRDAIGIYREGGQFSYATPSPANGWWKLVHDTIARESGVFFIGQNLEDYDSRCERHLLSADTLGTLDIIELSFRLIDRVVRDADRYKVHEAGIKMSADDAIEELNDRFREHGVGYQYIEGSLVRVDSQFVHAEVVKPALALLNAAGFEGPEDEFVRAFVHYRHGRHKEAVAEALKAFESTMKAICKARKWTVASNATAIPLINTLLEKGLIPADLESHFSGLRSAMESGLPTISNKTSRHGQGAVPTQIPPHLAAYALHLAAANIVLLVEAHKALP